VAATASTSSSLRRRNSRLAGALGASLILTACGSANILVTAEQADQIRAIDPEIAPSTTSAEPDTPGGPDTSATTTAPSRNTSIDPIDPDDAMGDDDVEIPEIDPTMIDPNAIDFGDNKPARPYDDFLLASLADIDAWLQAEFEPAFGIAYEPLQGSVYAGYPERSDSIPGCGEPRTTYEELQQFVAFYCPLGDFIVYDDGANGLLADLADQFGPATIGIVLAHEYGHALQERTGALLRDLPTVATEQQADCIAGAWSGRAASGNAPGVPFNDTDIRAGLISMITVQDPVGIDPNEPGGHGSGFDRVGAFQVGFQEGLSRCAQLIDNPLPLTPVQFLQADFATGGNAPFGFEESDLFGFLVPDLNLLFDNDLQAQFPNFTQLTLVSVQLPVDVDCASPFGLFELGVELCAATNTVYLNEPVARDLYDDLGDFAPGYLLGVAWAEAAQISNGSSLNGEARQLQNDCLVGAWVDTVTRDPVTQLLPTPRDPEREASISPNDLTEAIQTAIIIGDPGRDIDILGSAFEKIDAFRQGALGGIDVCV
jgi:predicted metalloprotease